MGLYAHARERLIIVSLKKKNAVSNFTRRVNRVLSANYALDTQFLCRPKNCICHVSSYLHLYDPNNAAISWKTMIRSTIVVIKLLTYHCVR